MRPRKISAREQTNPEKHEKCPLFFSDTSGPVHSVMKASLRSAIPWLPVPPASSCTCPTRETDIQGAPRSCSSGLRCRGCPPPYTKQHRSSIPPSSVSPHSTSTSETPFIYNTRAPVWPSVEMISQLSSFTGIGSREPAPPELKTSMTLLWFRVNRY